MSDLIRRAMVPLAVVALSGTVAACSDDDGTTPEGQAPMSISFAVAPQGGLAAGDGLSLQHAAETLLLESVELQVEELVLERVDGDGGIEDDGDSDSDSDSDHGGNEKFAVQGAIIDLPVDGGLITPLNQAIPAGRYDELELDILAVRLAGTVDGESFLVLVPVDLELEMDFEPPLDLVEGDPFNVTVNVDPIAWLRNDDGSFIDPRELSTDATLMNLVRQRMAVSFDAFEDSDHDADSEDSDSDSH